jgi:hypothetical protein
MDFTTIFLIGGVVLLAIFFLIAKLAVRWFLRLTIVGVILIALLGAGVFWWWSSNLTSKPEPNTQRSVPGKRNPSR